MSRLLGALGLLALLACFVCPSGCDGGREPEEAGDGAGPPPGVGSVDPGPPPPPPNDAYELADGDVLFEALTNLGARPADVARLVAAAREVYDLARVRAGNRIEYRLAEDGSLEYFRYDIDPENYFEAEPGEEGFAVRAVEIPFDLSLETLGLTLTTCLYCDAEEAGWDANVLWQISEKVFAWEIDFFTDIREGDTLAVLVERKDLASGAVRYGRVLASIAKVDGRFHAGVLFETDDGEGYYDLEGHSLRRPFLRSPLQYTRISSRFTYRRRHPILRVVRPGLGVDFAAPSGTPVRASADGAVIFKGRNGGFGNFVKLRHANRYETWYGHLRSYARGLRTGQRVRQGQVIGYVGSTGLSTGPHLDYRMRHRGRMINPLQARFQPGPPLPDDALPAFRARAREVLEPLEAPADEMARLIDEPAGGAPDESPGAVSEGTAGQGGP